MSGGHKVDVGEGIAIGLHAAAKFRALVKAIKAAKADGFNADETIAIVEGPGADLVRTLLDDFATALED